MEVTPNKVDPIILLGKVPLLKGLSQNKSALEALSGLMILKTFPSGHTLLTEGQMGDEFFVMTKGTVSVYKKTPEGEMYKVVILKASFHPALGEGGLIESEPRSATVICDEPCEFLVLTRDSFSKFSSTHPEWALPILKEIAVQLMTRIRQTSRDVMLLHKALMNEIRG
jgi:CRP-like cAMP-binding protein